MAQFPNEHFNKPSGAAVSCLGSISFQEPDPRAHERQGRSVKKVSIESALAMSATALSKAEKLTRSLGKMVR